MIKKLLIREKNVGDGLKLSTKQVEDIKSLTDDEKLKALVILYYRMKAWIKALQEAMTRYRNIRITKVAA